MKEMSLKESWTRLAVCVLVGLVMWFWPQPSTLGMAEPEADFSIAWHLASVFIAVIVSFILRPFPMGVTVILGFIVLVVTRTISIKEALSGYADTTVWLVVAAFFLAGGVVNTGLGRRIALLLVTRLGHSAVGLAYAICGAELLLGPIIPSNTVRGGGILAPIVRSLAESLDSRPDHQPETIGRYLVSVGAHANLITASMFLTGMAANPLVAKAAASIVDVEFGWGRWALGAIVPGLLALLLLPWLMRLLVRPTLASTSVAQRKAREELQEMGDWTRAEIVVAFTMSMLLLLWMTKPFHGMHSTLVAWIGIAVLLLTKTQTWDNVVSNKGAWDTFIWLGGLLAMANLLKDYGFVAWIASGASGLVSGLPAIAVVVILALIYYYSMYSFSMLTAHISAMVAAFLIVASSAGAPPRVGGRTAGLLFELVCQHHQLLYWPRGHLLRTGLRASPALVSHRLRRLALSHGHLADGWPRLVEAPGVVVIRILASVRRNIYGIALSDGVWVQKKAACQ